MSRIPTVKSRQAQAAQQAPPPAPAPDPAIATAAAIEAGWTPPPTIPQQPPVVLQAVPNPQPPPTPAPEPPPSPPFVPPEQPGMVDMLRHLIDSQKRTAEKFYLVLIPEDEWPKIEEHATIGALIAAIRAREKSNCHVFAFMGTRLPITKGPLRFLKTPYGNLPLFDPVDESAPEADHGWMGDALPDPNLGIPQSAPDAEDREPEDLPAAVAEARQDHEREQAATAVRAAPVVDEDTSPFNIGAPPE